MDFSSVKKNLEQKGYSVKTFGTARDAAEYLNGQIDGESVGMGGSVTLETMGLFESLQTHNTVFWHWRVPQGDAGGRIRAEASRAGVYLSSVNGLAETGEIVNIDGACNRVSSIVYGHRKVYLVVGKNKLAPDFESALFRARNVAAPRNAKRLKRNTPCAAAGDRCYDCASADRICRALSVLWCKPNSGDFEIVLVDENLGF